MNNSAGVQSCFRSAACIVVASGLLVACSSSSESSGSASPSTAGAGSSGTGGGAGRAASVVSSGVLTAGVANASSVAGSFNSLSNGGAEAIGGSIAGGGAKATGGSIAGGGTKATGGSTTGGGAKATGGSMASGGAKATGGSITGGGAKATGGSMASGGAKATGGSLAGGAKATGGTAGVGGRASATAGRAATGGSVALGGAGNTASTPDNPNVVIDRTAEFQTIDGFGFFGAQDVWWGDASGMWSDAWGPQVINDLGLTIWRNEYYSEESNQDANWTKQLPVVQGLKRIADANRVPLKFVYTVWTPPSSMKCTVESVQAGQTPCARHPDGLKNGGTLDPSKYASYAEWLIDGINKYAAAGVSLYALSPQNEPMFVEPYNSGVYDVDPQALNSYSRMIRAVAPLIKAASPSVKIFGTENMLGLEGQEWFYSANFDSSAWDSLDVLAYHGYQDGVAPTANSQLATYWTYVRTNWAEPHGKANWMTETSGYTDDWSEGNGARSLGYAIYSALSYGHVAAWIWWQGSELGGPPSNEGLMGGTQYLGKRYYVSKQFYRYIRPGAKMVKTTASDSSLFVVAFTHAAMGSVTIVAINSAMQDKQLVLGGSGIPASYQAYRTSSSEDCVSVGNVTNGSIVLKADSITTLVNGNVIE